jgi:hypothetical protein
VYPLDPPFFEAVADRSAPAASGSTGDSILKMEEIFR